MSDDNDGHGGALHALIRSDRSTRARVSVPLAKGFF